ncbi:rust resistance kinase Lr10-like [Gossypium arboreum]|uniref:rust resistance kinase Lr10-like n=1 Tax=Gossypium arboreum TaxID=29729 RepID=UPI0022F19E8A|nr:rust resistance kinase Lr10-like [Gossypium arboreum]
MVMCAGARTKLMISGISIGSFFLALSLSVVLYMHHLHKKEKDAQRKIEQFLEDYKALKPSRYSYADIKRITFDFKEKLGQGGYGTVFKGTLSNDVSVAVKLLNNFKGNGEEFINEVSSMGRIHHVNVTRLVGFCADGYNRALVYENLPNESLEKFIFGDKGENHFLGWEKLHEIALGIAKGIEYLHQGCEQRILHFDIKPHNILLDQHFNPKISDFGLAKLCSKEQSAVSMTAARGTMGYIAPEVLSRNFGNVSYKSDVYSFGMMLLEMVGGRKNIDVKVEHMSQVYFPEWVYNRLDKGEALGMSIENEEHDKIAKKLTIVGLWSIQWYPVDRPSMKSVVQMLEGEVEHLTVPPNPFASKDEMRAKLPINRELQNISE